LEEFKMQLKKLLSGALMASSLLLTATASNAAFTITFDPSAANGDAANKTIYAAQGAFDLTSIQTTLSSQLDIFASSGNNVAWEESGSLFFVNYTNIGGVPLQSQRNGNRFYGGGSYDIYATFLGLGSGNWTIPGQFDVTSITSFDIQIWASPNTGSAATANTPTSGTDATGGVSAGSKDFLLGTAAFAGNLAGAQAKIGSGSPFCDNTNFQNNCASTTLVASFDFVPASNDYEGIGGFLRSPTPFEITFSGSGSSNLGQSFWGTFGDSDGIRITTAWDSGATGNLTPSGLSVPEPGTVFLLGASMLGLAGIRRLRKAM
jgi:hypothetical protein